MLQQIVCWQRIRDIEHLEKVLTACWEEISQDTINRAIGQFRKRLSLVIAANGERIEHHSDRNLLRIKKILKFYSSLNVILNAKPKCD